MSFIRIIPVFLLLYTAFNCTNYSSSPDGIMVNTPIITNIQIYPSGSGGHYIELSAQNAEIGFLGYRIFEGISESAVFNAAPKTGTDCIPAYPNYYLLPNQGIVYRIEVSPTAVQPPPDNPMHIICTVPIALTPGNYVAIRAVRFSDFFTKTTGLSSNAVIVP